MKHVLLVAAAGIAATAVPAGLAEAQAAGTAIGSSHGGSHRGEARQVFRGSPSGFDCGFRGDGGFRRFRGGDGDGDGDRRRHRRGGRSGCDVSVGTWYEGGEWALYNNRSWESDSYNDWWHDRPDRAFPRWMQNNQQCDRMWWGGGVWRC